jgi:hypothetical protein
MPVLLAYLILPFGLVLFLCRGRPGSFAHRVGQLLALALGLGCLWLSYYLFAAGERAHWSSDGAGMLFVVIFMVLLAGLGIALLWLLLWSFTRDDAGGEDRLAGVRTAMALLVLIGIAVPLARGGWASFAGRHSHDAVVVSLYLTADQSELRSVDKVGILKTWDAASGRHRATRVGGGLSAPPLYGPSGGMLIPAWHFARRFYFLHPGSDLDALGHGIEVHEPLAALSPGGELVTASGSLLEWAPVAEPRAPGRRHFVWRRAIRDLAVSLRGETVLLDEDGRLVRVAGTPPAVTRALELPPRDYRKIAFSPSGSVLLAIGREGAAVAVLANGEVRELPDGVSLELFAFDGPDSLVCGREALTRVSFDELRARPITGPFPRATALVASRQGQVFLASGQNVFMLKPRWWSKDSFDRVVRLTDYRLTAVSTARRR